MVKLLIVLDEVGELACGGISRFDAAALGQVQLDEQLRTHGRREELLTHEAQHEDGQDHHRNRDGDNRDTVAERLLQQPAEGVIKGVVIAFLLDNGRTNQLIAKHRRQCCRNEPGQHQRYGHNGEEAVGKFRGAGLGKGDRHEAEAGNRRACQKRPGAGFEGEGRCLLTRHALGHFYLHKLHDNDGIIDEHTQGNNERTEGNLMQVNAQRKHRAEGAEQNQRDAAGNNVAAATAQRHQADHEHDNNCLPKAFGELADGVFNNLRLVGYLIQLQTKRQLLLQLADFLSKVVAELDIVAALLHGESNADSRLTVVVHERIRRVCIAACNRGDIAKAENLAVGVDGDGSNVFYAVRAAGDAQVGVGRVGLDHTAGVDCRLRLNRSCNAVDIKTELGQLVCLHLHEDFLRLHANQLYLFYVLNTIKVELDFFGIFAHILVAEAVAGKRINIAVYIIKAVIIIGAEYAAGEVLLAVVDNVTQLQPALADSVAGNLVLERHGDNADAGTGIAGDFIYLRQVLNLLFQLVGEVHLYLLGAGTGPGSRNNHLLHGEVGVLAAAKGFEGEYAHDEHQYGEKVDQLAVVDGPFRPVSMLAFVLHYCSPPSVRRTFCFSTSFARPAVISVSPLARPPVMRTLLPL